MTHDEAVKYAVFCLSSAQRQNQVLMQLMDRGLTPDEARRALHEAVDQMQASKEKERDREKITYRLVGLGLLGFGVAMLIYTFSAAQPGGMYLIPGGLIGYGSYMLSTGDFRGPF